tara:strand:- start:277 stop:423 length:147 start_codon:yes stop_codon:yes gene_type:complete
MDAIAELFSREQDDMGLLKFASVMLTLSVSVAGVGFFIGKPLMQVLLG